MNSGILEMPDNRFLLVFKHSVKQRNSAQTWTRCAVPFDCCAGTPCTADIFADTIQCPVSTEDEPRYEDCAVPLCADLPLCNSSLESLHGTNDVNSIATVSSQDKNIVCTYV